MSRHGRNAVVLDIGAVTIFWALDRPDIIFHAYEPNPQSGATLRKNIATNKMASQVKIFPEAISASREPIKLWIDVPTELSTSYDMAPGYDGKKIAELGGRKIEVPAITLDDAWERAGRGPIWTLKIDVEGAEGEILDATSDEMLANVRTACIEWHNNIVPGVRERCLHRLACAGFKMEGAIPSMGRRHHLCQSLD
jgi:FkbM family methyltransferase